MANNKHKTNKRTAILTATLCATMAIGTLGTYTYLTDHKNLENTFWAGNVKLELTEPKWNEQQKSNIVPGQELEKNPILTNVALMIWWDLLR